MKSIGITFPVPTLSSWLLLFLTLTDSMPNFIVEARFVNSEGQRVTQSWQVLGVTNSKAAKTQVRALIEPFATIVPPAAEHLTGIGIEMLGATELPKIACLTTTVGRGKLRLVK